MPRDRIGGGDAFVLHEATNRQLQSLKWPISIYHADVCSSVFRSVRLELVIWCSETEGETSWLTASGILLVGVGTGTQFRGSITNHDCIDSGSEWHHQSKMATHTVFVWYCFSTMRGSSDSSSTLNYVSGWLLNCRTEEMDMVDISTVSMLAC